MPNNVFVLNEPTCMYTGRTRKQQVAKQNQEEENAMRDRCDFLPPSTINWLQGREELLTNLNGGGGQPCSPLELSGNAGEQELTLPPLPVANEERDRSECLMPSKLEW